MANKVYVLQQHLCEPKFLIKYSNSLDWNKEYVEITDSFMLSQKKLLLEHGANVIESNIMSQFSIDFPIQLNYHKLE